MYTLTKTLTFILKGSAIMLSTKKKEVIPFKVFMSSPATRTFKGIPLTSSIYSFLPPMTLMDFIPIHDPAYGLFLLGSGLIIGIALLEKIISGSGATELSAILSTLARFAFPGVGFGVLFWFLLQL
jgi:hypothetical protein